MTLSRLPLLAALLMAGSAFAAGPIGPARLVQPGTVSAQKNEYNLSASDDARTMVFARSEAEFAGSKIMVAQRRAGRWSRPVPIGFSDDRYRDSDPWLTPDGRTLYFVSDRPTASRGDRRDLDIWRSARRADGGWGAPEHLGDIVNGKGEELGPELHGGTLYFATARRSGKGGLDVYAAERTADGFAAPKLMPDPINSTASESDFTLSRDGRLALFWRQVDGRGLIHVARRAADGGWSEPRPLPDGVNVGPFNFTPALSADGRRLTFASTRLREGQAEGMADIYQIELTTD